MRSTMIFFATLSLLIAFAYYARQAVQGEDVRLAVANAATSADERTLNWTQWGGSPARNNVPNGMGIPTSC